MTFPKYCRRCSGTIDQYGDCPRCPPGLRSVLDLGIMLWVLLCVALILSVFTGCLTPANKDWPWCHEVAEVLRCSDGVCRIVTHRGRRYSVATTVAKGDLLYGGSGSYLHFSSRCSADAPFMRNECKRGGEP